MLSSKTQEKLIKLGTFEVSSGILVVSDPCYELGTWCQGILENVKNGIWKGYIAGIKDNEWGARVSKLFASHIEHTIPGNFFPERTDIDVGVDSGQAGIFDKKHYHGKEDDYGDGGWYDLCCNITLSKEGAGIVEGGIVSSSGFGDGEYVCDIARNKDGQIIGVQITFIDEEDMEENYSHEYNDEECNDEEE